MTATVSADQRSLPIDEFETFESDSLELVAAAIESVIGAPRSVALVVGGAGVGKDFAVRHALAKHSIPVLNVSFTSHAGRNDVLTSMLRELLGEVPPGENYHLRERLRRELRERPTVLIVRRAERIKRAVMDELEWLFDDRQTKLRAVFIGDRRVLSLMRRYPSLEDCVARSVRFEALSDADAAAWLSQHPLYRDVSPAVIRYVNRNFAHGSLRAWKRFTRDAAEMCDQTGEPLTHEIANTVFALQRGAQLLDEHDQGENDP